MTAKRMQKNLWYFTAFLLLLAGVVGSLGAWEQGSIGLLRMLLQTLLFSAMTYASFQMAARRRRRAAHRRPFKRAEVVAVPAA